MAAQNKKREINLLPPTEFETSRWGQILAWAIGWGRYLLILIELVVIAAFLSRFKLDRDVADLKEKISGQVAIIKAAADTEAKFRSAQTRLKTASAIIAAQTDVGATLDDIVNRVPPEVILWALTLGEKDVSLTAATVSPQSLSYFLAALANSSKLSAVELAEVASIGGGEIKFTVKMGLEHARL